MCVSDEIVIEIFPPTRIDTASKNESVLENKYNQNYTQYFKCEYTLQCQVMYIHSVNHIGRNQSVFI